MATNHDRVLVLLTIQVFQVLRKHGKRGKGGANSPPRAMAAYQVLNKLPVEVRDEIIETYGLPGKGSGSTFAASQMVSRALMRLGRLGLVKYHYVTTVGMYFVVADRLIEPSYQVCAFYQLTDKSMKVHELQIQDDQHWGLFDAAGKEIDIIVLNGPDRDEVEE